MSQKNYILNIKGLTKTFPKPKEKKQRLSVLEDINLSIKLHEFITIVGPNACGKSTLLKVIAGLLDYDSGEIELPINKIGFVFQDYSESLFPWFNALDNIALPLRTFKKSWKQSREEVKDYINKLDLNIDNEVLSAYPYNLSGGQKQLVAILRALILNPKLLLLDEPFASLDLEHRIKLEGIILDLWEKIKISILFVSHDIKEAIYLADRLILLSSRPASIRNVFEISLPRPRSDELLRKEAFLEIEQEVIQDFKEEMKS